MSVESPYQKLRGDYHGFCQSLAQTEILCTVATHALSEFPKGLPEELESEVEETFGDMAMALHRAVEGIDPTTKNSGRVKGHTQQVDSTPDEDSTNDEKEPGKFGWKAIEWVLAVLPQKDEGPFENAGHAFRVAARQQAAAMLMAHLDAFLLDAMRSILVACPQILKSERQLSWESALGFESIEDLRAHLTSEYVAQFGRQGVLVRVQKLMDLGVENQLTQPEKELLELFEQRRHLIIHGAGIVTPEYIRSTGDDSAPIGSLMEIHEEEIEKLSGAIKMLGSDLVSSIARKFMSIEEKELHGIWRRKGDETQNEE